jgi:hypothetical protein
MEGLVDKGLQLAGAVLCALVFLVITVGGGVYRTDCVNSNGSLTRTRGIEGYIPYLWTPGNSSCQAHTLTRYVLGKVGILGDVGNK